MMHNTCREGSRHHAGGRRVRLDLQVGILEDVPCVCAFHEAEQALADAGREKP